MSASFVRSAMAQSPQPISITVTNLMPWSNADGEGVLQRLAREIASRSGHLFDVMPLPYARGLEMLRLGKVDLMLAAQSDRLDSIATRIAMITESDVVLLARRGLAVTTIRDMRGLRVGHLRQTAHIAKLANVHNIVEYECNNYSQALQMVEMGRLDALVCLRSALDFAMKSLAMPTFNPTRLLSLGRASVFLYQAVTSTAVGAKRWRIACECLRREKAAQSFLRQLLDSEVC